MSPDTSSILDDLLSGDRDRILAAVGVLHGTYDRGLLDEIAPEADRIEAATKGIDLGGAFLPNTHHLAFAISKLRAVTDGHCLCQVVAGSSLMRPQVEASRGLLEVLSEATDRDNLSTDIEVRCDSCGTQYRVTERIGWHLPTYEWRKA